MGGRMSGEGEQKMEHLKSRAARNRTLTLSETEMAALERKLLKPSGRRLSPAEFENRIIHDDFLHAVECLPDAFADLMILDPPYNLTKEFRGVRFASMDNDAYIRYLESWFPRLLRLLKPNGSLYLCGDWKCSAADYLVMSRYVHVRNRIVWQREKGRGALSNWKNCCEDIWFGTVGGDYYFDVESVKMKRKVIAPYRQNGKPKDWEETEQGRFRMTCPSNFWDDISVPYWSMPENTDHPTQKPEKLIAKLILASSRKGDFVFDPFLGSGTTAVVARKLGRRFTGIEISRDYCCWGQARLERAVSDPSIQGYAGGVFWERNSLPEQKKRSAGE